ncbi:MAG: MMPL family transporter [Dehalococcoidales bacterium]|nr:MMPL family transporter [Dehalococcoidales bacterium]
MFAKLGQIAQKYSYIIIAGWVILTVILVITAPSLSEVGITDQGQFLPQNTESAQARNLIDSKFGDVNEDTSSLIIVTYNEYGLSQQDMDRAEAIHDWLVSSGAPSAVSGVISVFENDALNSTLVSTDNTTMLMTVELSIPALDDAAAQAVNGIRTELDMQSGTTFYVTGTAGLMQDLFNSVQNTISRTTLVTIILVVVLLLIIYRSPIAFLVPLITIGISYLTAKGIVGFLAGAGIGVSTIIDAYLVVTIFGVGTDYCLFIVSRFREELHHGQNNHPISNTMKRIGPIILASAITVIIAFLCLGISRFGMTKTSGWALAIGIMVTLAAGLTLVPALMGVFGRYLFWPSVSSASVKRPGRLSWGHIGKWVSKHPIIAAVPIIIVLALPYIALPNFKLSANVLSQLPKNVESAEGLNVIRDHFPMGDLSPLYLVIQSPDGTLLDRNSLNTIEQISQSLGEVEGISRVDYFAAPSSQLNNLGKKFSNINIMSSNALPNIAQIAALPASLESLSGELTELAFRYSGITQSTNFTGVIGELQRIQAILTSLSNASTAEQMALVPQLQTALTETGNYLTSLSNEFELNGDSSFIDWLKTTYFSTDGTVTRINLILSTDPYADNSSETVTSVRTAVTKLIDNSGLSGAAHYIGGELATHADMLETSNTDFILVLIITSIGILLVIIILLRSLLAPLYMVLTVLFNFGATLGITAWLFIDVLKGDNLVYLLPVFVFVMLAAVGADYNIFLVSRIREESEKRPLKEAVQYAVANTGGVITSCGIILAGTFATLAASPLPMVLQIGAPIAIGVLIDTFLVRAILVPALATIAGRWSWWPSCLAKKLKTDYFFPHPDIALTNTVRSRGPSNSQKKMPCHVPRTNLPFSIKTVCELPNRLALICAGELPSLWR